MLQGGPRSTGRATAADLALICVARRNSRSAQNRPWSECCASSSAPARLPSEPEALLSLYRSKLSGQRALIIADDIRDGRLYAHCCRHPAAPSWPPSRNRIPLTQIGRGQQLHAGARWPAASDASQLLRSLCPRLTSSQASELSHRCVQAPLALGLMGLLPRRPRLAPGDVLAKLESERARLESPCPGEGSAHDLMAVAAVAYRSIDPWGRQLQIGWLCCPALRCREPVGHCRPATARLALARCAAPTGTKRAIGI